MAAFEAGSNLSGLTHHSDHGSNYMSLLYTSRIAELGAAPSTESVGNSYDCPGRGGQRALQDRADPPTRAGRTVEHVELATLEYVWCCNNQRLHGELGYRTPAEAEAEYYGGLEPPRLATASHGKH